MKFQLKVLVLSLLCVWIMSSGSEGRKCYKCDAMIDCRTPEIEVCPADKPMCTSTRINRKLLKYCSETVALGTTCGDGFCRYNCKEDLCNVENKCSCPLNGTTTNGTPSLASNWTVVTLCAVLMLLLPTQSLLLIM